MTEEYDIKWKKCNNCGYLQHESHLRCLKCKKNSFTEIKASGLGKLLTFTVLSAPPMEFRDKKSYAIGVIEFENGIKVLGQLSVKENLKIGMKLEPTYTKLCNDLDGKEVSSYIFKPVT